MKRKDRTDMRIDAIRYYVKEAVNCVKKNRLTTMASIGTTVAALLILGVIVALTFNINSIAQQFSRDCEIQVFISNDLDDAGYDSIGEQIKKIEFVEGVEKYTKVQILEEMKVKLKDNAEILEGFENDNPFRNSFKVSLTDLTQTGSVARKISAINGVENTTDFQEAAGTVVKVVNTIRNASIWLVIILCIVSAFIVSNAIRVSVHSRRKEINIMKYIGATDWFIRWPFIIEGIIIGLYGALITFVIVWIVYARVYASVEIGSYELLSFSQIALPLVLIFVFVGAFIGAVGSIFSIRKHLKV